MIQTIESREVAKMLNMRHDNLIQKIRNITTQMNQSAELKNKVAIFTFKASILMIIIN